MINRTLLLAGALLALAGMSSAQEAEAIRPIRDEIGFCWNFYQMQRLQELLKSEEAGAAAAARTTVTDGITRTVVTDGATTATAVGTTAAAGTTVTADMAFGAGTTATAGKEAAVTSPSASGDVLAAISPHDDYLYAGRVYYPLFSRLRCQEVLIIGLTHGAVRREIGDPQGILILDEHTAWRGMSGSRVSISPLREALRHSLPAGTVAVSNKAHALEHSIEALLPWLQYYNPQVRITPLMVTAMSASRMDSLAALVAPIVMNYLGRNRLQWGRDFVVLLSTDANHYGPDFSNAPFGTDSTAHARGTALDQTLVHSWLAGELHDERVNRLFTELTGATYRDAGKSLWCGRYAIPFGLKVVQQMAGLAGQPAPQGRLLHYSDTYSGGVLPLTQCGMGLTAPFSLQHWVGFFSLTYSLPQNE